MADYLADRILYYSKHSTAISALDNDELDFIMFLKEALKRPNPDHRVMSCAAYLFWMYGFSDSEDIKNAIMGFLGTGKKKPGHLQEDYDDVIRKVEISINAIKETFAGRNLYDDEKGESHKVEKDTKITPSLLRQWSELYRPLHSQNGLSVQAAIISLLYKPLQMLRNWENSDSEDACLNYVCLLEKCNSDTVPINLAPLPLLEHYVRVFNLEEVENIEVENGMTTEDTNATEKVSRKITGNGKINSTIRTANKGSKSMNKENDNHINPKDLIGVSYVSAPGHRTIVGVTKDGNPESVPKSTWQKYLPRNCSKQERVDWKERYPDSGDETKHWEKQIKMSYEQFCNVNHRSCYRLLKHCTSNKIRFLACEEEEEQLLIVNAIPQKHVGELIDSFTWVEEGDYNPKRKRTNEKFGERQV